MILEGHAIKITNLNIKDFKNLYEENLYNIIYKRLIDSEHNINAFYYCINLKNIIDYAAEWWIKEYKYIIHESLEDYYKYINPIINYSDI
jgi:hypothetical protein